MKKLIFIFSVLCTFSLPMSATASTLSTQVKELNAGIDAQQVTYDKYSELSAEYLKFVIENKLSYNEVLEYQKKIDDCRKRFLDAAKKMQELRIELFELTNM